MLCSSNSSTLLFYFHRKDLARRLFLGESKVRVSKSVKALGRKLCFKTWTVFLLPLWKETMVGRCPCLFYNGKQALNHAVFQRWRWNERVPSSLWPFPIYWRQHDLLTEKKKKLKKQSTYNQFVNIRCIHSIAYCNFIHIGRHKCLLVCLQWLILKSWHAGRFRALMCKIIVGL